MKKILSHGLKASNLKYITICPHCNCKFEYTSEDIEYFYEYAHSITSSIYKVRCPECNLYIEHATEVRYPDNVITSMNL